jgi:outer membrane murein-binding lipoprotein Lpp
MPTLRNVLMGTVFSSLLGGGVAFSYKQNLISTRKQELLAEREELQQDLRRQLSNVAAAESEGGDLITSEEARRTAFRILWDDRIARYHHSNAEALSYLQALPEALGAMKGLVNHYRFGAEELRHFVGFDVASSKVHNFALLNDKMLSDPRQRSAALMGLFASEPLIGEVARSLEAIGATPHNMDEIGKTFDFCVGDLELRMEKVAKELAQASLSSKRPESMIVAATEEFLENFKVPLKPLDAFPDGSSRCLTRKLRTADDVKSALRYADDVLLRLSERSSNGAVEAVRSHPHVSEGAAQLAAWQAGAATFLVEHQAHDALSAYQSLLALSLAQQYQPQQ